MRKFIKENKEGIIGIIIFYIIIFLVSIGGTLLIKNGYEEGVLLTLLLLIFWVILLNIKKGGIEKKYKQLLHFAYKFYKKEKKVKADEYDHEDYTIGDFEEEFENWLREKN